MSSIYILEPPTKGKVVLNTSVGDIDIELWPKEAPKAVRNFVQLCLDGYYDGTIFHRVIKEFMAQGGDKSGTGTGGESIYGAPFPDEIHSRLKFNRRGLVACANAGKPNSNNSQFFITLGRTEWLDKKNTIFGKVTGDTVYNAMKLGEVDIGKEDRPLDPPQIYSVEVLWNPFDDVVPRAVVEQRARDAEEQREAAKPKKKEKKQLNLLSFGEEAEEEEQELATVRTKIKSSHDVLQDARLLKEAQGDEAELDPAEKKRREELRTSVRQTLAGKKGSPDKGSGRKGEEGERFRSSAGPPSASGGREREDVEGSGDEDGEQDEDFDARMRRQILDRRQQMGDVASRRGRDKSQREEERRALPEMRKPQGSRGRESGEDDEDDEESDEDNGDRKGRKKVEKLQIKKKGTGSEAKGVMADAASADRELLSPLELQRQKYKERKRALGDREKHALAMLATFQKKLKESKDDTGGSTPTAAGGADEDEDANWFKHRLKFTRDPNKPDDMARNEDPNQYVVHDPLLEKGKEKFNKQQAKLKKHNKEWAGRSLD